MPPGRLASIFLFMIVIIIRRFALKVVGLTGGIASGKSTVSRMFEALGARIVDADRIAREVVAPGREAWSKIVEHFGRGILLPDGSIDREKLGRIVFDDAEARAALNSITNPAIIADIAGRVTTHIEQDTPLVMIDAALLFEIGVKGSAVGEVILVTVEEEIQVERIVRRNGLTPEDARKRIAAQMPLEEKKHLADHVIDSSGTLEETRRQVEALWDKLTGSLTPDT